MTNEQIKKEIADNKGVIYKGRYCRFVDTKPPLDWERYIYDPEDKEHVPAGYIPFVKIDGEWEIAR